MGAPSLPPGRYFRMHLVGYFEGIDSERGLEWRCADSLSLRAFLGLELRQRVPDHSWLSRTRERLPLEVHEAVFAWVLARLAERGLVKGERIGIDASTMEANATLRSIRRRAGGEGYRAMLTQMAEASGVPTPTTAERYRGRSRETRIPPLALGLVLAAPIRCSTNSWVTSKGARQPARSPSNKTQCSRPTRMRSAAMAMIRTTRARAQDLATPSGAVGTRSSSSSAKSSTLPLLFEFSLKLGIEVIGHFPVSL